MSCLPSGLWADRTSDKTCTEPFKCKTHGVSGLWERLLSSVSIFLNTACVFVEISIDNHAVMHYAGMNVYINLHRVVSPKAPAHVQPARRLEENAAEEICALAAKSAL
jgi:hypothetical protein